jgi:hypothetical protein
MTMWTFFTERGPAIAVWLVALAAQISGFTSVAIALGLIGLAAFFLIAPTSHHVRAWHRRRVIAAGGQKVLSLPQIFLLIGLVGTWLFVTVGLSAAAWMIWTGQGSAVGSPSTGGNTDEGPMQWFRNLTLEGGPLRGGGLNVFSLKFRGVNISQKEVELKSASIISAINGTKLPLEIIAQNEIVSLDQVELIPPGAPVDLIAKFGPPDPNAPGKILGLEPKTFLETWRQFSLNVQDDSKSYRISFNEGDLAPFFPGMVGPHVTRKSNK